MRPARRRLLAGNRDESPLIHCLPNMRRIVPRVDAVLLTMAGFLATDHTRAFGLGVAVLAYLIMGGSNIVWFEVFTQVQAETQVNAVTVGFG